jgi:hypothetical protein
MVYLISTKIGLQSDEPEEGSSENGSGNDNEESEEETVKIDAILGYKPSEV